MRATLAATLAAACLAGCASAPHGDAVPHFEDVPSAAPLVREVTVTSRMLADPQAVAAECYMRSREGGVKAMPNPTAPACSWREANGRIVLLWADPRSYNNHLGMESGGHELRHWHEGIDHR